MIRLLCFAAICLWHSLFFSASAQTIERIEPANWWIGMRYNTVTLLVYGPQVGTLQPSVQYNGVKLLRTAQVLNPNYLFLTLRISPKTVPGVVKIQFKSAENQLFTRDFPLLARDSGHAARVSFSQKDAVLLVVPDRFANGNPANDFTEGSLEMPNRSDESGRHGGDLEGLIGHLDYIQALGFTQIWSTPLVENNMPKYSYHGYAATDFYRIDPRFGTNELFKKFVTEARQRQIGVIWDVVLNHCGSEYYFAKDPPSPDWFNLPDTRRRTNHLKSTLLDPYAPPQDRVAYTDGWFDSHMPDLNQQNPLLATFLIQNTLWWIEYAGLSGFREDTYSYADKDFLARWSKTILEEYPYFNIVGEEMTLIPSLAAYWQKDKINADGYISYLPTLMDFLLTDNVVKSLNTPTGWFSSWREVYQGLAQDYHYAHPDQLLIFPDNHDLDRIFHRLQGNFDHWKLAMAIYMTMRGIPQFYYGTELLMTHPQSGNDGQRRGDFYGGWAGDTRQAISGLGLTEQELAAQAYFRRLLNWRKGNAVIHNGQLTHYAPERDDVYVYFRHSPQGKVMVILNKSKTPVTLEMGRFSSMLPAEFAAFEVVSGQNLTVKKQLNVPATTAMILEIK
jgi:neopullulanase